MSELARRLLLLCVAAACGGGGTGSDGGLDASPNDVTVSDATPDAKDASAPDVSDASTMDAMDANDAPMDVTDAHAEAGPLGLACGNGYCPTQQGCCVDPGAPSYVCTTEDAGTCTVGMALLFCATAADCTSSQVCCLDGTTNPPIATCTATCTALTSVELCDPLGLESKNHCGDAGACGNANINTWLLTNVYGTCGDRTGSF